MGHVFRTLEFRARAHRPRRGIGSLRARLALPLAIAAILVIVGGCDDGAIVPVGDTPSVLSTYPADGDTLVPSDTVVTVLFDRPMDRFTLSSATFVLEGPRGVVDATVTAGERSATLTPRLRLSGHSCYTARLDHRIADAEGTPIGVPYAWSFTTGVSVLRIFPDVEYTIRDLGPDGDPDELVFGGPPGRHLFAGAGDGFVDRAVIEFPLDAIEADSVIQAIAFFTVAAVPIPGGVDRMEYWGLTSYGVASTYEWSRGFLIAAFEVIDMRAGTTYACRMTEAINEALSAGRSHAAFRIVLSGGAYAEIASTTGLTGFAGPFVILEY